ncbi:NUDIX hydrolase [Verminephrobacter aporrectodeae]|uniref:NUDIX hydrolase n=1 Tax=Verminephrobacter aporrectodeae TaxID=1110389 RepID=UPI00023776C3|nr:NUDIX domain-containing protein [Verminephrobacter aporrectodeae]
MNPPAPSDSKATKFPVSVKGVLINDHRILLLKNERDEWELPGGKLELHEEPTDCLAREILEETGISVRITRPLRSYVYWVADVVPVLIVPFICECENFDSLRISNEHKEIATFDLSELDTIRLPMGYRTTISDAIANT